jgi:hypothetical protein
MRMHNVDVGRVGGIGALVLLWSALLAGAMLQLL